MKWVHTNKNRQKPHQEAAAMNQKFKIIAPSKNTFQNMGELQNCSLKKCILEHDTLCSFKKLLSQNACLDNYSVSDSNSDFSSNSVSDSDSDSDFSSASMHLVIFVFFILYLHSSK